MTCSTCAGPLGVACIAMDGDRYCSVACAWPGKMGTPLNMAKVEREVTKYRNKYQRGSAHAARTPKEAP